MMRRRLTKVSTIVFLVLSSIGSRAAGQGISYTLNSNEYLFVNGVQQTELVFSENSTSDEVYLNGVLVDRVRIARGEHLPIWWPGDLPDSEPVKKLIAAGNSESQAMDAYKSKIYEFRDLAQNALAQAMSGEKAESEAMAVLHRWMEEPGNKGLVVDLALVGNRISWRQAAGGETISKIFVHSSRGNRTTVDLQRLADGYISKFVNVDESQILLVSERGVETIIGDQLVPRVLEQISNCRGGIDAGDGPLSLARLKAFGFLKGDRGD